MSLPSEVEVGPFVFRVASDRRTSLELAREGKLGDTQFERLLIRVRGDMVQEVQEETLVHEILHAVWALTPLAGEVDDQLEERVVRALSPYLFPLVRLWLAG